MGEGAGLLEEILLVDMIGCATPTFLPFEVVSFPVALGLFEFESRDEYD